MISLGEDLKYRLRNEYSFNQGLFVKPGQG